MDAAGRTRTALDARPARGTAAQARGVAAEAVAVDVRRVDPNARPARKACPDDALHRCCVAGVASAGDVDDIGEPVKLLRLVVVFAAVEVQ